MVRLLVSTGGNDLGKIPGVANVMDGSGEQVLTGGVV